MGFAGVKLSGSLKMYGYWRIIIRKIEKIKEKPKKSFKVKYGWKGIL